MAVHAPRLALSLDPLIAEAKRRARQRRMLTALAVLLLAGLAAGLMFAFRTPGGGSPSGGELALRAPGGGSPYGGGLTSANYSLFGVSLRYPAAWTRLDCGNLPGSITPISLLTSAQPAPTCHASLGTPFLPPVRLGSDGAVVVLSDAVVPGYVRLKWNAIIDRQPASIPPRMFGAAKSKFWGSYYFTTVPCPTGVRREYRAAYVKRPRTAIREVFMVGALICGPHIATGDAAVRNLIASMRVTR